MMSVAYGFCFVVLSRRRRTLRLPRTFVLPYFFNAASISQARLMCCRCWLLNVANSNP